MAVCRNVTYIDYLFSLTYKSGNGLIFKELATCWEYWVFNKHDSFFINILLCLNLWHRKRDCITELVLLLMAHLIEGYVVFWKSSLHAILYLLSLTVVCCAISSI